VRKKEEEEMTPNFDIEKLMFDSSCISDYMGCPRLFYYSWIRRLVMKEEKPSLTFGRVFHEALLEWYKREKEDEKLRIQEAISKFATLPSMITVDILTKEWGEAIFKQYVERYKTEVGKTLHLEVKFKVEIGDRLYAGTMDRIEEWTSQIYVDDHKTSARLELSDCSHRPSPQLDGYCWACRELVGKCHGAVINGISTAKNPKERFIRFPSSRTDEEMDGWKEVFTDTTDDILRDVERKHFPKHTNYCNRWGKCKFWELCVYGEDERFIEQNFKVEEVKSV
jgi:hypothetical protein